MRLFESSLLIVNGFTLVWGFFGPQRTSRRMSCMGLISLLLLISHVCFEGMRWQMLPIYLVTIGLESIPHFAYLVEPLNSSPPPPRLPRMVSLIATFGFLGLGGILSMLMPVFKFPNPTGTYAIGTTSLHLTDKTRRETFFRKTKMIFVS